MVAACVLSSDDDVAAAWLLFLAHARRSLTPAAAAVSRCAFATSREFEATTRSSASTMTAPLARWQRSFPTTTTTTSSSSYELLLVVAVVRC